MANSNRLAKSYLAELSEDKKSLHEQGFEPLVRYLEANAPLASRVGYSVSPKQDFVRFGQTPLLSFFPAAFTDVKFSQASGYYKLRNSYFGMLGINGPLPLHLTEHALERQHRHKDNTFSQFLDIFNHRFISLFYRAWADSQPAVSHDRPSDDSFKQLLSSISGQITVDNDKPNKKYKLETYLSGLLSHKNRSASVLEQMLAESLTFAVNIKEFVGAWYPLNIEDTTALGKTNSHLGISSTLGTLSFQRIFKFAINIGPLTYQQYQSILADTTQFDQIESIVRKAMGAEFEYDINIYLDKNQSKSSKLGNAQLGQNSWCQGDSYYQHQIEPILVYKKESNA
ncbi:type VI secretion system baseplate subunit TssG [Colwellia sp. MEBiC06753]